MNIQIVPNHLVAQSWPSVERFFADVEPYVHGEWTLDQLRADMLTNRLGLLVALDQDEIKGAAAVSFQNRRNSRTAFISALAGSGVTDDGAFAQLKLLFAQQGCTHIEAAMRDSTFRLWRGLGFEEKYRIVGMKL